MIPRTRRARSIVLATSVLLAPALGAAADVTVVLTADRDNTLIEDPAGAFSNGAGDSIFAGRITLGTLRRAVLHFPVAGAVPPGSVVTGATVRLYMSQTTSGARPATLHRCLADWGEGTSAAIGGSGADSTPNDATWIHTFYPTSYWATPGGDFVAAASATQMVGGMGPYAWSSAALAADVQAWVDNPASNFGWVLRGDESGGTSAKRFDSRESSVGANVPVLEVTYAPPSQCPVDRDGNGQVQPADVATFVTEWFSSLTLGTLYGDFDGNGAVQPADVATFVSAWFAALSSGHC